MFYLGYVFIVHAEIFPMGETAEDATNVSLVFQTLCIVNRILSQKKKSRKTICFCQFVHFNFCVSSSYVTCLYFLRPQVSKNERGNFGKGMGFGSSRGSTIFFRVHQGCELDPLRRPPAVLGS